MEKGVIETVDNFLDSLGTTGRVAVELTEPTGVTGRKDLSNATEALKKRISRYRQGNKLKLIKKNNANKRRIRISSSIR